MFRLTRSQPETSFPHTLPGLNMLINPYTNQPVNAVLGTPFAYFIDSDTRINDVHKEAFHAAMRGEMKLKLAELGITEHYITAGNNFVVAYKPAGKHVPVLMNSVSFVQNSRDVIIIVGESSQDCGVLAWRLVREKEGLKRGTAVGLAGAVKEMKKGEGEDAPPAVVILNPGQLFYSHREKGAKTLVSWNDGARNSKTQDYPDAIDEENQVEGHKTAGEHVNTFIEKILPGMINEKSRLYFIAIGDGAQNILASLDKQMASSTSTIPSQTEALALVCPQITTPTADFSPKLLTKLAHTAKSWVCSNEKLGELLATPPSFTTNMLSSHRDNHPTMSLKGFKLHDEEDSSEKKESPEETKDKEIWDLPPPLAPTFSAGKSPSDGVTETAFDCCMSDVLAFLWMRREQQLGKESMARKLECLKFQQNCDAQLAAAFEPPESDSEDAEPSEKSEKDDDDDDDAFLFEESYILCDG